MRITNRLDLPEGLVRAVTTEKHNAEGALSATTLLKGVKEVILTSRYWDEMTDDAADRIWAVFGTAVHALLESEGESEFTEVSLSAEVDGVCVTGRIDNYNMETGVVADYKTASIWKVKFQDFDDWRRQGLIYSWLLRVNDFKVTKCRFIALLKDHSKTEARRDSQYPQSPVFVYEFDVTWEDLAETEKFIRAKIAAYNEFRTLPDDDIPPCSPEERWQTETKFAARKEGRKSAVKLFSDEKEAADFVEKSGKGFFVEKREGVAKKCADYCVARGFCSFAREKLTEVEE